MVTATRSFQSTIHSLQLSVNTVQIKVNWIAGLSWTSFKTNIVGLFSEIHLSSRTEGASIYWRLRVNQLRCAFSCPTKSKSMSVQPNAPMVEHCDLCPRPFVGPTFKYGTIMGHFSSHDAVYWFIILNKKNVFEDVEVTWSPWIHLQKSQMNWVNENSIRQRTRLSLEFVFLFIYLIFKCFIVFFFSKRILRYSQYNGIYFVWNETQEGKGEGG